MARGADAPAKTTYIDHVRPIFQEHCFACHSQDDMNSDLALDSFDAVLSGGAGGEVVAAGDPGGSRLWALVTHQDSPQMPPGGDKLPAEQLELIRQWIEGGLLENSGSKPRKGPTIVAAAAPAADNRPAGDPAMPAGVLCEPMVVPERPAAVGALAASPWAPLVAVGAPQQVSLYHLDTGDLLGVLPYLEGEPVVLRFSRDGATLLVAGGRHGAFGNAALYDVATGVRTATVGEEVDAVLAADVSPDQSLVAVGGPKKVVRVYRVADGSVAYEIRKHTDWVTAVAFSPDGTLLATADRAGGVYLWDAEAGLEAAGLSGHNEHVTAVAWRADSQLVATASEDDTVRLWTTVGKQVKSWQAHGGGVLSLDVHRDGQIVTAGRDRKLKLWDAAGKHLADLATTPDVALSARLGHDAKAAVVGDWQGGVRVVDVESKQTSRELAPNPPRLATRLELAAAEVERRRDANAAAGAAVAAAEAALAEADAQLAAQQRDLRQATETAAATNRERVALAKQVATRVAQWKSATEAAAAAADQLVAAEQKTLAARQALQAWRSENKPEDAAQGEALQKDLDAAVAAEQQARAAAEQADKKLAAAREAKTTVDRQAASADDAHRAAAAEAAARRKSEPAADRAAAAAKLAECQEAAGRAARAFGAAEQQLQQATQLFDAYAAANEQFAAAATSAAAATEAAAVVVAQHEEAQQKAAAELAEAERLAAEAAAQLEAVRKRHEAAAAARDAAQSANEAASNAVAEASARRAEAERAAALAAARVEQFKEAEVARSASESDD